MQNKINTAFERLIFAASSNTMRHWDSVYEIYVVASNWFAVMEKIYT